MTNKERVLMELVRELYSTQLHLQLRVPNRPDMWKIFDNREDVHFECSSFDKIQIGDLVLCTSSGIHDWTVGFVHEIINPSWHELMVKEIGTNRLCKVGNEGFVPIRGMSEQQLWNDDQYNFSIKVKKAFAKGGHYSYRFGGMSFVGDKVAVYVREHFNGTLRLNGSGKMTIPFKIVLDWDKKMSIKKILELLVAGGYGSRKFDEVDDPNATAPRVAIEGDTIITIAPTPPAMPQSQTQVEDKISAREKTEAEWDSIFKWNRDREKPPEKT